MVSPFSNAPPASSSTGPTADDEAETGSETKRFEQLSQSKWELCAVSSAESALSTRPVCTKSDLRHSPTVGRR
jgi:hypothetical protein